MVRIIWVWKLDLEVDVMNLKDIVWKEKDKLWKKNIYYEMERYIMEGKGIL